VRKSAGAAVGPAVAEVEDILELLPGLHDVGDPQGGVQDDGRVVDAALGDVVLLAISQRQDARGQRG
jgi:hypothetical protein